MLINLRQEIEIKLELLQLKQQIEADLSNHMKYNMKNILIYYNNSIVIASDFDLRYQTLTKLHTSSIGGHGRIRHTLARVKAQFF